MPAKLASCSPAPKEFKILICASKFLCFGALGGVRPRAQSSPHVVQVKFASLDEPYTVFNFDSI